MFSSALTTVLLLVSLLLVGCARENEPAYVPAKVQLKGTADCLTDFGKRISDFANEKLNEAEVRQTWDCAAQAISDFQRLTAPDADGRNYTPQGVRHFLERFFVQSSPIGDSLLLSVMNLKRVLVGGSTEVITGPELDRLKELLAEMRDISVDIRGLAGVIFMNRPKASDQEVREASFMVEAAGRRLGRWIEKSNQAYAFSQLQQLVKDILQWNDTSADDQSMIANLEKVIAILPDVKHVLIAGERTRIAGNEWERALTSIVRAYSGFLTSYYSFDDLNTGLLRRGIPLTLDRFSDLLEEGIRARDGKAIPSENFNAIFEGVEKAGWLDKNMKPGAMMGLWVWANERVLKGKGGAIGQAQVEQLRTQVLAWNTLLDYAEGRKVAQTPDIQRFEKVLAGSRPALWDDQNRILFSVEAPAEWSAESKRHMVWPYTFINILREAYGDQGAFALTEAQVTSAVEEILPLLQNFGWLATTQTTIGSRLVREANLFTQSGNGDGDLDMGEAVRYLAFVASAFRTSELWVARANENCGQKFSAQCLRQLGTTHPDILSAMPRLQAQLEGKPNRVLEKYMRQAEETILDKVPTATYGVGDLTMVMMLFQYVETFYERFDSDNDERIRLDEAANAYIIYQNILGRLLEPAGIPPEELDVFFTFMLKYGNTPGFSTPPMFGGLVAYNHWKWFPEKRKLDSTRPILMGILNQLSKL